MSRKLDRLEKSAAELTRVTGGECIAIAMDVRKLDEINQAVEKAIERFGTIDILINGAAGNFLCAAESLSPNAFKTVIEIDTVINFMLSKEFERQ